MPKIQIFTMTSRRLRLGIGAVCSVNLSKLHPQRVVEAKYVNFAHDYRVEGLLTLRIEKKQVNHRDQWCVVFRHSDFPNQELHAVRKWCKVVTEGAEASFLEEEEAPRIRRQGPTEEQLRGPELPSELRNATRQEDVAAIRAAGFDVDDDNEPVPENLPDATDNINNNNNNQQWGWDGIDKRKQGGNVECQN
jgi:hypothetical protein